MYIGMNVQHWLADVPEEKKDHHSPVVCLTCTKTHFIHNSTGEMLGTQVEGSCKDLPRTSAWSSTAR